MRILVRILASITALLVCCQAMADVNCSRSQLGNAVNAYIEAQTDGDPDRMPLAPRAVFMEQMERIDRADSIVNTALAIDFHRSLLDEYTCQTYTEVIVRDESHPYSIGTRLRVTANAVSEVEVVVTDEGDWLFNAQDAFDKSSAEDWSIIPESERSSRATLEAAANAYFDQFLFGLGTVYVPWGYPCHRLEGGVYTGNGSPTDSCAVGVPNGDIPVNIAQRRFVTDVALGATVGLVRFGAKARPDVHLFRLEHDKLHYVHTLTVCDPEPMCGGRPGI
jgi:hypothetical protein